MFELIELIIKCISFGFMVLFIIGIVLYLKNRDRCQYPDMDGAVYEYMNHKKNDNK